MKIVESTHKVGWVDFPFYTNSKVEPNNWLVNGPNWFWFMIVSYVLCSIIGMSWSSLLILIPKVGIAEGLSANFVLYLEMKWNDGVLGLFCAHCSG